MRSYGQYCALAKALDVVGDRWTLLIVRELLLRGACRYTDLRNGLPGIATNLLADRLRALEGAGLLEREEPPPPVASTLFRLTPRGEQLKPVLNALGRWGIPYMVAGPDAEDEFRNQWLARPAELFLADTEPAAPPVAIELRAGEGPMVIETSHGAVRARAGSTEHPDAVLSGAPQVILGVLSGELDLPAARDLGLHFEGDARAAAGLRTIPASLRMHTGAGLFVRDVCEGLARGRASGRGRALVAEHHVRLRCGEPSVSQGLAQADAVDDGLHALGSDQPPGATRAARASHSTRGGALRPACPS